MITVKIIVFVTDPVIHVCSSHAKKMGAVNKDVMDFLSDNGRRITQSTDDHRESTCLFQRLSVLIQRGRCLGYLHPHNPRG